MSDLTKELSEIDGGGKLSQNTRDRELAEFLSDIAKSLEKDPARHVERLKKIYSGGFRHPKDP